MDFWAEVEALTARLGELSYFEILGVSPDVSSLELTEAYHRALRRFHPDRHVAQAIGGASAGGPRALAQICARVGEAYRVLSSAPTRAEYVASLAGGQKRQRTSRRTTLTETRDPKSEKARNLLASARTLRAKGSRSAARAKLDLALQFEPESDVLADLRDELDAEDEARRPVTPTGPQSSEGQG